MIASAATSISRSTAGVSVDAIIIGRTRKLKKLRKIYHILQLIGIKIKHDITHCVSAERCSCGLALSAQRPYRVGIYRVERTRRALQIRESGEKQPKCEEWRKTTVGRAAANGSFWRIWCEGCQHDVIISAADLIELRAVLYRKRVSGIWRSG